MDVVILASLLALGLVFVVWLLALYTKSYQARIDVAWQPVAQKLGGHFHPPTGPWYKKSPRSITATVSGAKILVDHYTVSSGKSSVTYTRVRAAAEGAGKLRIKIYKEHIFSTLGKALGFQDVLLGDPDFDQTFVVKANDEDLARVWVHAKARRAISFALPYEFTLKDNTVTTLRPRLEDSPEILEAAIRATAELANSGQALLRRWRAVAAETGGALLRAHLAWETNLSSLKTERRGAPVEIDTSITEARETLGEARLFTRVRGRLTTTEKEPFGVFSQRPSKNFTGFTPVFPVDQEISKRYQIVGQDAEKTKQRLRADICHRILKLAPYALLVEAQYVSLFFLGMETDPARIRMATELVGDLAAPPSRGPYR